MKYRKNEFMPFPNTAEDNQSRKIINDMLNKNAFYWNTIII